MEETQESARTRKLVLVARAAVEYTDNIDEYTRTLRMTPDETLRLRACRPARARADRDTTPSIS
jgi:hypothetical protein